MFIYIKIAWLFIFIIHVLSVYTLCISFNYFCIHGYGQSQPHAWINYYIYYNDLTVKHLNYCLTYFIDFQLWVLVFHIILKISSTFYAQFFFSGVTFLKYQVNNRKLRNPLHNTSCIVDWCTTAHITDWTLYLKGCEGGISSFYTSTIWTVFYFGLQLVIDSVFVWFPGLYELLLSLKQYFGNINNSCICLQELVIIIMSEINFITKHQIPIHNINYIGKKTIYNILLKNVIHILYQYIKMS